jgi:hypothetical protein
MARIGRPPRKNRASVKSTQIGVRLTPPLIRQLKEAATARDWTLSEEVTDRLKRSFDEDEGRVAGMIEVTDLRVYITMDKTSRFKIKGADGRGTVHVRPKDDKEIS